MKKQLIVFTTSYYPFVGGVETAIHEISRRLSNRFDICIITGRFSRDLAAREIRPEGTVIRVGFGMAWDKWLLLFWGAAVARQRITADRETVLWGVDISQGSLAALWCKMLAPRCLFVFNIQYGYGDGRLASGRLGMIGRALRRMLARADAVTVISSYLGRVAIAYGYGGPIKTIHNGVDAARFALPAGARRVSEKTNAPVVITTSRLVEKNGVDTLIRAIAILKNNGRAIRCHILGDGPDRPALERLAGELGVTDEIEFFGSVPFEKIPGHLHEAAVFARLSRSEGMGVSFVEALAAGLPVIGTPVGGIPDIITDGITGLFARPDDPDDAAQKIMRLLDDGTLRAAIVENGTTMVRQRFEWDSIAAQYAEIFMPPHGPQKRVLIATGLFPPEIGGPATYSKLLQDELPRWGFSVTVLPFNSVRYLPKIVRHAEYARRLLTSGRHADVIFAQDPVSVGIPAAAAAMLLRKKFVLKIVGDYAWEQSSQRFGVSDPLDEFLKNTYGWRVELLRRLQKWSAGRADAIVVPSEYLRGVVAQWGIARGRIAVIYNAFDPPVPALSKDEARKKLGISGTALISPGRLVPWKGFDALVELGKRLHEAIPGIHVMIIGSGPERHNLEQEIREQGADAIVSLAGNLSHEDVLAAFIAGDAFILNTRYEGFSHTLLEAMAMGIPVCTTRAGGNTELIQDGETGLFFDWNDIDRMQAAIMRLVHDPVFARRLSEQAQEKARSFSTERMLGEISALLKDV